MKKKVASFVLCLALLFGGFVTPSFTPKASAATVSIQKQLLELSDLAYSTKIKVNDNVANGWTVYKIDKNSDTSFEVKVFRKKVDKTKYDYVFAFKGTKEAKDVLTDAVTVVLNMQKLQINNAETYVKNLVKVDSKQIATTYFTGHSLGGYIAAWLQTEVVDGDIKVPGKSYANAFNAPGLSLNVIPTTGNPFSIYKLEVAKKIANEKLYKYDKTIVNYNIKFDPVSTLGIESLGVVNTYRAKNTYSNPFNYHKLERLKEISF